MKKKIVGMVVIGVIALAGPVFSAGKISAQGSTGVALQGVLSLFTDASQLDQIKKYQLAHRDNVVANAQKILIDRQNLLPFVFSEEKPGSQAAQLMSTYKQDEATNGMELLMFFNFLYNKVARPEQKDQMKKILVQQAAVTHYPLTTLIGGS